MGTHRIRLCSIPRDSLRARNSYTALLIQLGIPIVSVRKLHKHPLHVVILAGPLFVEGLRVDAIAIPQLRFVQAVIATCNSIEKTHSERDRRRYTWFGSHSWWQCAAITVPVYLDNTVHSPSPSTRGLHVFSLTWLMISFRMLLKVMPLGCRATSGSLVKHSHSNCDEQHNTRRPTVTLKEVLPMVNPVPETTGNCSSPSHHDHHSRVGHNIVRCDQCPNI